MPDVILKDGTKKSFPQCVCVCFSVRVCVCVFLAECVCLSLSLSVCGYHYTKTKTPPPQSPKSWLTGKIKKRKIERAEAEKSLDVDELDSFQSDLPTKLGRIGAVVGGYKGTKAKTAISKGDKRISGVAGAYIGHAAGHIAGHGVHTAMREYKIWKEKRRLKKIKKDKEKVVNNA